MDRRLPLPLALGIALIGFVVALIAYGSLYPFAWRPLPDGQPWPSALLAGLRHLRPGGRGDLLANILLYLPLGGALALTFRGRMAMGPTFILAAFIGGCLSLAIETLQLFDAGRDTRGSDVVLNTVSSILGVALTRLLLRSSAPQTALSVDRVALLLLAAGLGARLYPYVPSIDLQAWKNSLKPLLRAPTLEPSAVVSALAFWVLVAEASAACLGALVPAALAVAAVLIGALMAKVIIVGSQVTFSESLGLGGALLLWLALSGMAPRRRACWFLPLLLLGIVLERFSPFVIGPRHEFGLIPFRSFLEAGGFGAGIQSGLGKLFSYGGLLWIGLRAGIGFWASAGLSVAVALLTSLGQMWLPGRSAEITDAILAGLAAVLISSLAASGPIIRHDDR